MRKTNSSMFSSSKESKTLSIKTPVEKRNRVPYSNLGENGKQQRADKYGHVMKILLIGDLHNEEEFIDHPFIPRNVLEDVDLVVQTGDCHYAEEAVDWLAELDKPVFFIPGNHEFWNVESWHSHDLGNTRDILDKRAKGTKVEILLERQTTFGGVRFIGATLWTDIRGATPPSEGKLAGDMKHIVNADGGQFNTEDWLAEHDRHKNFIDSALSVPTTKKTIVATHHFPTFSSWSVDSDYERHHDFNARRKWYGTEMEHVVKRSDIWFHGHTHRQQRYLLDKCQIACNPRGYKHEPASRAAFKKDFIIQV